MLELICQFIVSWCCHLMGCQAIHYSSWCRIWRSWTSHHWQCRSMIAYCHETLLNNSISTTISCLSFLTNMHRSKSASQDDVPNLQTMVDTVNAVNSDCLLVVWSEHTGVINQNQSLWKDAQSFKNSVNSTITSLLVYCNCSLAR